MIESSTQVEQLTIHYEIMIAQIKTCNYSYNTVANVTVIQHHLNWQNVQQHSHISCQTIIYKGIYSYVTLHNYVHSQLPAYYTLAMPHIQLLAITCIVFKRRQPLSGCIYRTCQVKTGGCHLILGSHHAVQHIGRQQFEKLAAMLSEVENLVALKQIEQLYIICEVDNIC